MKTQIHFALILLVVLFSKPAQAEDGLKFTELRLLGTTLTFANEPTGLNSLTTPDNVQKLDSVTGVGLEADAKYKWFKVGTRLKYVLMSKAPASAPSSTTSYLTVSQYTLGLLARLPIVDKEFVQFDVLIEVGGADTSIDVATSSSGRGTFKKDGSFYQRAGASIAVGSPSLKIFLEAGQEWNNLSGMTFSGTLANNVSSADFSGPYFTFGLIISGMPSWIKPGGITVGN